MTLCAPGLISEIAPEILLSCRQSFPKCNITLPAACEIGSPFMGNKGLTCSECNKTGTLLPGSTGPD